MTSPDDLRKELEKLRTESLAADKKLKSAAFWQETARTAIGYIIVSTFAVAALAITFFTLFDVVGSLPAPPPASTLDQYRQIIDERLRPLEFLGNFLSSFVLPVVTLVMGYYFGKAGRE